LPSSRQIVDMRLLSFIALLLSLIIVQSCSKEADEQCAFIPPTSNSKVNIEISFLEDSLLSVNSKEQLADFFSRHVALRDLFFNRPAFPDDTTFINERFARFTNPHLDTLLTETHRIFGNSDELKKEYESAFANLLYYYPSFVVPKVETTITGLESDLFVNDSLVIIGLDYYLGESAKYKPDMYEYMQRRYNKNFIVPSTMLLYGIDAAFNKTNLSDKTTLAEMITYGKAYYFAKQMQPCIADSVLIGYTKEEMNGSRKNESLIWSRFIEDEVLFSTSHQTKQKYIAERPKTLEVGEKCPGRIGQWVGWQIVKKYMETHPEVTLPQLMEMQDPAKLFKESGYKPQVVKLPNRQKA
jgi:hypothetical protein